MQPATDPQTDRTFVVAPDISHVVPWRVKSATVMPDFCLRVTFVDGLVGEVNLERFLSDPKVNNTFFEPLRDSSFFAKVYVDLGAVMWPNGADLAPDTMHEVIRQHGVWVL